MILRVVLSLGRRIPVSTSFRTPPSSLRDDYKAYINNLKRDWLAKNRTPASSQVYELMSEMERGQVRATIAAWSRYVTPLAEAWWKERGYRIEWPDDDSQPMRVIEIED
jgi:molybdopterin-guanine dinucleotide biosynthesis protein A